jgi:glucose-6-phosphate isomerase
MGSKKIQETKEWKQLEDHFLAIKNVHLRELFNSDPDRVKKFSLHLGDVYFDFSKNLINEQTLKYLTQLARISHLEEEIEAMFSGEKINRTEDRPVLHVALRALDVKSIYVDNQNIMVGISKTIDKMKKISEEIRSGERKGFSGKNINTIVNIGIGGSDLGPRMVTEALTHYSSRELNFHFVANVDGTEIAETLKLINAETTLFIVASKSFTTLETRTNAETAKNWIQTYFKTESSISKHFLAVTANKKAAMDFGIPLENIFEIWNWVGGRYSLCSAVGLPIMISTGYKNFIDLLKGFNSIDTHFKNAPLEKNIPVIMALIGIWYNNFFNSQTHAIIPYDHYLNLFPCYLQQLDMESNGKSVDREGNDIDYQTGPVIWGGPGTNGQHAFFQLLHQGTKRITCDFIGFIESLNPLNNHHHKLMANFFAQTQSLAFGNSRQELDKQGVAGPLKPFRTFTGNRATNTILIKKLTPYNLGQLIALYEHKVFAQGIIWNIYSFDQWGVELGKAMAKKLEPELKEPCTYPLEHDGSTNELINLYKKHYPLKK